MRRWGILVSDCGEYVNIAASSNPLKAVFNGTPWSGGWSRTMTEFAESKKIGATYFAPGIKSRGVRLPMALFADDKKGQ